MFYYVCLPTSTLNDLHSPEGAAISHDATISCWWPALMVRIQRVIHLLWCCVLQCLRCISGTTSLAARSRTTAATSSPGGAAAMCMFTTDVPTAAANRRRRRWRHQGRRRSSTATPPWSRDRVSRHPAILCWARTWTVTICDQNSAREVGVAGSIKGWVGTAP